MSNRHYILDKNGEPIPATMDVWAEWYEKDFPIEKRRVARTKVGNYTVSTVFLGLDHQWGKGPPVLWETMLFVKGKGHDEQDMERCSGSREQAEAMHERMVKKVKAKKSKVKK